MSPRHDIADKAAKAWGKYESTVRCGGTDEQRRFAFEVAVKAEGKLAAFDLAQKPVDDREALARALSGA
jgi:hypothetical protein